MFKRLSRITITMIGALCGIALADYLHGIGIERHLFDTGLLDTAWLRYVIGVVLILFCGLLSWFLSRAITEAIVKTASKIDEWQSDKSLSDLLVVAIAIVLGLLIAYLFGNLTAMIPSKVIALLANLMLYLLWPYVCTKILWKRRSDFQELGIFRRKDSKKRANGMIKVIDSSALIDGRIYDVCKAGFIEGRIVIPDFVVNEIMKVADSEDTMKRNRGRRALDIIKNIQDELRLPIEVRNVNYDDVSAYDVMLLRFAVESSACIITTDYNLNKAANVHNVKVLNINELTNALKTVLVPGEELSIKILKAGKERNQGLAYLDDGTMIVVENGIDSVGETRMVTVTNVMQTAAGRMIFARIPE